VFVLSLLKLLGAGGIKAKAIIKAVFTFGH
jgi:hypothetical protein